MRKFSTGGYTFYMLKHGERAPNPLKDTGFCGAYLICQLESGLWHVRQFKNCLWQEITKEVFETESAAFNHVYKKYCDEYNSFSLNHKNINNLKWEDSIHMDIS